MKSIKNLMLLFCLGMTLNVMAQTTENVVFKADFNDGYLPQGWAVSDANGDGATWTTDAQLNGYFYNGMNVQVDAEDWLFTPSFAVEQGKHYILSYTFAQRGAYGPDYVAVAYGASATVGDMTNTLVNEVYDMHAGMVTRNVHLTFDNSADYVMGFKVTSAAGNGILSLKDITIRETSAQNPQNIPAMVANMDDVEQAVTIEWINPKKDSENAFISSAMNALIWEDGNQVATVENVVPGEASKYVYKPANFSGKHTIAVSVIVDGYESEKISKELNYDDVKGSLTPIFTMPLKKKADFESWKVTNADNDAAKWQYYSGSAYISAMGKNVNDWLITPGCELEPGKRYVLTYDIASSRDYSASFDVTMGSQQSSAMQNTIIATYNDLFQNGFANFSSVQFEVETAGTYYFGFHARYVGNSLDVSNVVVNLVEAGGEVEEEVLEWEEPAEDFIADNINGDLSIVEPYHEALGTDGVELYGAFTYAMLNEYDLAPNGIFHVTTAENGYNVTLTEPVLEGIFSGSVVHYNGLLYCNEYDATGSYHAVKPVWKIIDAKTLKIISQTTLNDNCENTTISMAYDETTHKIYGFVKDYTDTHFVEIDPATGAMKRIGGNLHYYNRYLALACNDKGELYCVYMTEDYVDGHQTHYLGRINKENGVIVPIGELTGVNMLPNDLLVNMKMAQSLFFNNKTGKMYWWFCGSSLALGSQYAPIYEINTLNANTMLKSWRTDIFDIAGAYFVEPLMQAPDVITNASYTPESEGSLNGTIQFTMPETTYKGAPLASTLKYKVLLLEDRSELYSGTAAPGETITINHTAPEGIYDLALVAINEVGESVDKLMTVLIGYDKPYVPVNLLLENVDYTTIRLTWDAPTTGIHGKAYDKSRLSYNIYSYPNTDLVAENITENYFIEVKGDTMARNIYAVFSCYDGEELSGVISNQLITGLPLVLDKPYGGIFANKNDMYDYYTILDENKDYYTWAYDGSTGAAFYAYNYQSEADDWMISPPIQMYEGDIYTLTFTAFSTAPDYLESLLVTLGDDKKPFAQNTILLDMPELPAIEDDGTVAVYSVDIAPSASGVYYYGFQAYSKAWQSYLYLYNVSIERKVNGAEQGVQSRAQDFDAYNFNNGITVINPLAQEITIYDVNGRLVHQSTECEYNVALEAGVYVVRSQKSAIKVIVR